jgi:hypothetical protein
MDYLKIIVFRIIDPIELLITLALFVSLSVVFPKLYWLGSALLASAVSMLALVTIIAGAEHNLPEMVDVLFARFIAAMIQCGIASIVVYAWRERR